MGTLAPILLLGFAGMLVGGAVSLFRQGAPKPVVVGVGLVGTVAAVGGVLWLVP